MSRISDEELRRLLNDTTPGPWSVFIDDTGGRWTGWPLSIDADTITDKVVVRTGGQWPYEWDAKTSQHEACENARLIALSPALAAEVLQLRDTLAAVAGLGGNLTDEYWEGAGGPNDAGLRGGLLVTAMQVARAALAATSTKGGAQ